MPLNDTIPDLNTCGASPHYCTASYSMFYMWQKEGCGRKGEICSKFFTIFRKSMNLCVLGSKSSGLSEQGGMYSTGRFGPAEINGFMGDVPEIPHREVE